MNSVQKKSAALKFLVWRSASSVGWDCTQQEIADDIGVSVYRVSRICIKAGWHLRGFKRPNNCGYAATAAVDTYIRSEGRMKLQYGF